MTEETQPVSTEQPASTEAPAVAEQSLEDVFQSFKIEPPAQESAPAPTFPREEARKEPPHVPDPISDPEAFKRYEQSRAAEHSGLQTALHTVATKLNQIELAEINRREEADIAKAVGYLQDKVPDADPDMLEVYLGHKARKDPRVLEVWKKRYQNPRAWDAALKAIGNEMAGKFTVKADPQLAENQRAMKTAQQTMATASKEPSLDEKLGKLHGAAFDRAMDRIRNGFDPGI